MSEATQRRMAAAGLVIGGLLGMVGSFLASPTARALAWGLDGIALVVASAILTVLALREREDALAIGYLLFLVGQAFVLSSARMDLVDGIPSFTTGMSLWAAALMFLCIPRRYPSPVRVLGLIASALFTVSALQVLAGHPLTALARPLPFFAFPFFVAALWGIAWTLAKR